MSEDSELVPRLVTAGVLIPVLLGAIYEPSGWAFVGLAALAAAGSVWEYCGMILDGGRWGLVGLAMVAAAAVVAVMAVVPGFVGEALMASLVVLFSTVLFTFDDIDAVSREMNAAAVSVVYAGLLLGALVPVRQSAAGADWIVLGLVTVWMSDTGAYFTGRAMGDTPLAPEVSPNKSVEGAVGGVLGSVAGAFACNFLLAQIGAAWSPIGWIAILVVALPANVLAQVGDLCESLVKRAHGADDSGSILYGHGGLLDRIDGLIFASPWVYVCAVYLFPHAQA